VLFSQGPRLSFELAITKDVKFEVDVCLREERSCLNEDPGRLLGAKAPYEDEPWALRDGGGLLIEECRIDPTSNDLNRVAISLVTPAPELSSTEAADRDSEPRSADLLA
jgi:hypothetical protein